MRQTITLQKVIGRDVTSQARPVRRRAAARVRAAEGEALRGPRVGARRRDRAALSSQDGEAQKAAAAKIEEIRAKITGGAPFADLAKEYSEGKRGTAAATSAPCRKASSWRRSTPPSSPIRRRSIRRRSSCRARSTSSASPTASPPASSPSPRSRTTSQADLRRHLREAVHRVHGQAAPRGVRQDLRPGSGKARRRARRRTGLRRASARRLAAPSRRRRVVPHH